MTTKEKGISAKEVSELRQRTGAGMMDCKAALTETKGDIDAAIELLRKREWPRPKSASPRRERGTDKQLHPSQRQDRCLVEVNCETDFVARTDDFKNLVRTIAEHVAATAPLGVDKDQIPAEKIAQERRIFEEQVSRVASRRTSSTRSSRGRSRLFTRKCACSTSPGPRRQEDHRRSREGNVGEDRGEHSGAPIRAVPDGRGMT